ncbi:MAG: hypothetical protein GF401_09860 [Chitinivibrionales bacterium]|nr:hypothetical protein [Chitinivibrionales bacterium]
MSRSIIISLFCFCLAYAGIQQSFYVAPNGSDANDGTESQPLATINEAAEKVAAISGNMTGDIIVYVKAGTYYLTSPLELTEAHSGTNGFRVIFKNADGLGSARIIGGERITNWVQHSGSIYKTSVNWNFNTLYENSKRAWKARTPNQADFSDKVYFLCRGDYFRAGAWPGVSDWREVPKPADRMYYRPGDFDPSGWDIADAEVYCTAPDRASWAGQIHDIVGINAAGNEILIAPETPWFISRENTESGSRYIVQGILALLDAPGEFHLDVSENTLYYQAMDGEIAAQEIIAPKWKRLITVIGSSEQNVVRNIVFEGLHIEASDFEDSLMFVSEEPQDGMVYMRNTEHITFKNCHLSNSGTCGIVMMGYAQHNRVEGCLIKNMGIYGVQISNDTPDRDVSKYNVITNCRIHHVAQQVCHGSGTIFHNSNNNEVSYCEIYYSQRYLVTMKPYSTGLDEPRFKAFAADNTFAYLDLQYSNLDSGEGGAIEAFQQGGTPIYNQIYVDYCQAPLKSSGASETNWVAKTARGIYMDESGGSVFTNIEIGDNVDEPYAGGSPSSSENVSWQAGFDRTKMEYDKIGLNCDFPIEYGGSGKSGCGQATASTLAHTRAAVKTVDQMKTALVNGNDIARLLPTASAYVEIFNVRGQVIASFNSTEIRKIDQANIARGIHCIRISEIKTK